MSSRNDPVKNSYLKKLWYAVSDCLRAGVSVTELRWELIEFVKEHHRQAAQDGEAELRRELK